MGTKSTARPTAPRELRPFLSALPTESAEALVAACAMLRSPTEAGLPRAEYVAALPPRQRNDANRFVSAAIQSVGYPAGRERIDGVWTDRAIPMPDDLPVAHRALAEVLARIPGIRVGNVAMPSSLRVRRRWLGLEPSGILEREVAFRDGARDRVPLWRALSLLTKDGPMAGKAQDERRERGQSFVQALGLSLVERLQLLTEATMSAYRLSEMDLLPYGPKGAEAAPLDEIGPEHQDWAIATAETCVLFYSRQGERSHARCPREIAWPLQAALVRSATRIRPEWEPLLIFSAAPPAYLELSRAVLAHLESERRHLVLLGFVERELPSSGVQTALALLPAYPSVELTRFVLDKSADLSRPKRDILADLEAIAAEHPAVQAPLEAYLGKQPARLELALLHAVSPERVDDLTAIQQRQLEHAGKLYDGRALSAAERLAEGGPDDVDGSFQGFITVSEIGDASGAKHYDALSYMVDSGTVYRADTTEVVAEVIQGGLECDDPALKEALQTVL